MDIYLFLQILTIAIGFYMAWNIGANDVSNAMGTSVGSKALTLKQAVLLAAVLEFAGALFVGSHVSNTIQKGIISPSVFSTAPIIFALGMLGALFATGLWLHIASFFRLPVSTTHAIVGAIIGFGAVIGGIHAVHWDMVFSIVLSWIITPLISGILSYFIFSLLQKKIFYALNPIDATKRLVPFFVFFAFVFFTLSLIFEGLGKLHLDLPFSHAFFIALLVGAIACTVSIILLKKSSFSTPIVSFPSSFQHIISLEKATKHMQRLSLSSTGEPQEKSEKILREMQHFLHDMKKEVHLKKQTTQYTEVEKIFISLQIISAALVAFAHGANDVANAVGPVGAVLQVLKTHTIIDISPLSIWVLMLGGLGIVLGLATWGWRVIETIGKKITELTPTRGFSAEFAAAMTILLASRLGMPISTTHALVGGVMGVGLARGIQALNLKTLRDIVFTWVITIPSCAVLSIIIFYFLKTIFI